MDAVLPPLRPLKIIYTFRAPVGGLFRNVYDVARGMVAAGHQVGFICDSMTGGARGNALLDELRPLLSLGIHRVKMHRNPHVSDGAALKLVHEVCQKHQVDVLHGHGAKGGFYARFGGLMRPHQGPIRCYTPHGGSLNYYPGSLRHKVFMQVERLLERSTDLFSFESQFIADRYHDFVCVSTKPTIVALNGLYEHEFMPIDPANDATDLLYVGEFREAKGIDTLVDALTLLAARSIRPSITMVGSGPSEDKVRDLIAQNGLADQFRWRGVTPAAQAFKLGRVMVLPSRFESLPYIILEAVAAHLPMISTDVGGIPEILPKDYRYLLPPNAPHALADAIENAMVRPFSELRQEAARLSARVRAQFNVSLMIDTIQNAYAQILRDRRPAGA